MAADALICGRINANQVLGRHVRLIYSPHCVSTCFGSDDADDKRGVTEASQAVSRCLSLPKDQLASLGNR